MSNFASRAASAGGGVSQISFGSERDTNVPIVHQPHKTTIVTQGVPPADLERKVRAMTLPDLRSELRAMGLSPAGGLDTLRERLVEALKNGVTVPAPTADIPPRGHDEAPSTAPSTDAPHAANLSAEDAMNLGVPTHNNNYVRPSGSQNVGNFLTDRPTSRVLKAPGGGSSFSFA